MAGDSFVANQPLIWAIWFCSPFRQFVSQAIQKVLFLAGSLEALRPAEKRTFSKASAGLLLATGRMVLERSANGV